MAKPEGGRLWVTQLLRGPNAENGSKYLKNIFPLENKLIIKSEVTKGFHPIIVLQKSE